jgi:hypothetical protein
VRDERHLTMEGDGNCDEEARRPPNGIDKYLVFPAPGLNHRGYRRAEHAADRREPFTGFGACLGRLIRRDATKPPIDRELVRAAPLARAERRLVSLPGKGFRLAVTFWDCAIELMIRQNQRMNCSSEAAFAAAQVMSDGVAGGNTGQRDGNAVRASSSCVPVIASVAVRPYPSPLVPENLSPL